MRAKRVARRRVRCHGYIGPPHSRVRWCTIRDGGRNGRSELPPASHELGHVRVHVRAFPAPLPRTGGGGCAGTKGTGDNEPAVGQAREDTPEHKRGVLVRVSRVYFTPRPPHHLTYPQIRYANIENLGTFQNLTVFLPQNFVSAGRVRFLSLRALPPEALCVMRFLRD